MGASSRPIDRPEGLTGLGQKQEQWQQQEKERNANAERNGWRLRGPSLAVRGPNSRVWGRQGLVACISGSAEKPSYQAASLGYWPRQPTSANRKSR